ncbi:MAG: peptide deformylase [Planctomycetota bacterium]
MHLLVYPDPFLKEKAEAVTDFGAALEGIREGMLKGMYLYQGVGLAAIQMGVRSRVFVYDVSPDRDRPELVINPRIVVASTEREAFEEGCLSVPGIRQNVIRPVAVTLAWQDIKGREYQDDFEGLSARVIQHELDHLDGTLFVTRLGRVKQLLIRKALRELEERGGHGP